MSACTSSHPVSPGETATSNHSTPASVTNASTSITSGPCPRPAWSSATGNTTRTDTAAAQPWDTKPPPTTLPPVHTNERLSFAVDQFMGSGHSAYRGDPARQNRVVLNFRTSAFDRDFDRRFGIGGFYHLRPRRPVWDVFERFHVWCLPYFLPMAFSPAHRLGKHLDLQESLAVLVPVDDARARCRQNCIPQLGL